MDKTVFLCVNCNVTHLSFRPSESGFMSVQRKKVIYGRVKNGEIIEKDNRKVKGRKEYKEKRDCAATLSDLYPSTCLTWVALPGV